MKQLVGVKTGRVSDRPFAPTSGIEARSSNQIIRGFSTQDVLELGLGSRTVSLISAFPSADNEVSMSALQSLEHGLFWLS